MDVVTAYENIYQPLCDALLDSTDVPVTLLYMPMEYISRAIVYGHQIF